ncbi:nucleotide-diphospho-sugar transferase [Imleria badia]|nr:nucleotide-diphospho-sugar transferase [Imleria badia]
MSTRHDDAIGDRINIVLTIDSGYAMPAAVTLRSIAENVRGNITIYIVDCGLVAEDKQKIETSLPVRPDITILFIDLPPNAIASKLGPSLARIDVMKYLPVERAIYLDADVLVRKDLTAMWNTNLEGHPLAAAPDIGRRRGVRRDGHFNSGVLLMDLAKTRTTFPELERRCYDLKGSRFYDQDPLNAHFKDDWVALDLTWNAQGLGTYAEWAGVYEKVCPEEMNDPAIVHFTGPIHPSVGVVLDFFQQPATAKPWGYLGAPGHPYEKDWWDTLDRTAWRGWKDSVDYKATRQQARMKVLKTAKEDFDKWIELRERIRSA